MPPTQAPKHHVKTAHDFVDRRRTIKPLVQACAECRRLKLRCSRTWPCTTCIKRGCGSVCPEGELTGGWKQARETLIGRVKVLENILQDRGIPIPPLDGSTAPVPVASPPTSESDTTSEVEDLYHGLGLLSIAEDTNSRYVGPSAGSAWMAQSDTQESLEGGRAGRDLALPQEHFNYLYGQLPPRPVVVHHIGLFYTNLGWLCAIVQRSSAMAYLQAVYVPKHGTQPHPHQMAIIFLFVALGILFDPSSTDSAASAEGRHFYALARMTLVHSHFLSHPTISSLQALHMLGIYHHCSYRDGGGEAAWPITGMAMRLVQAMGLHRDGSRWGLTGVALDERRRIFYEWYTTDAFQSLCFGRPYAIPLRHIDCEYPEPPEDSPSRVTGNPGAAFNIVRYRLCGLLNRINDEVFGVKPPEYSTVIALDRRINEWTASIPPLLRYYGSKLPTMGPAMPPEPGQPVVDHNLILIYERHTLACNAQEAVIFLHRGYFARALNDNSSKLATSFATSVNAVTRACHELIAVLKSMYSLNAFGALKQYYFWYHAFGATVCLAALIIRNPASSYAASAWKSLTTSCEIYNSLPVDSHPRKAVPVLHRLFVRARDRYFQAQGKAASSGPNPFPEGSDAIDDEVCLSMLGVSTKLVALRGGPAMPGRNSNHGQVPVASVADASLLFEIPYEPQPIPSQPSYHSSGQPSFDSHQTSPPRTSHIPRVSSFDGMGSVAFPTAVSLSASHQPHAPYPRAATSSSSNATAQYSYGQASAAGITAPLVPQEQTQPRSWLAGADDASGSDWQNLVMYSLGLNAQGR